MVRKKNKIVVEPFDDIKIVGVASYLKDYQLAWHVNKTLNINLIRYDDIINEEGLPFSYYLHSSEEQQNAYNLVSLTNDEARWIKLSTPTDYIIIIRNFISDENLQATISKIRNIPGVIFSYLVDLQQNKKLDIILEEIELHEINLANKK